MPGTRAAHHRTDHDRRQCSGGGLRRHRGGPRRPRTHYQLLQGRARATATLNALGAWDRFEQQDATGRPVPVLERIKRSVKSGTRAVSVWTSNLLGVPVRPDAPVAYDPERSRVHAVNQFLGRLGVAPVQNSRLVEVSFRHSDPALAARVVNTLATTYIAETVNTQESAVRDTSQVAHEAAGRAARTARGRRSRALPAVSRAARCPVGRGQSDIVVAKAMAT